MLEYAFFNAEPSERFLEFLEGKGLKPEVRCGDPETLICVEESRVDDDLADVIDRFYDEMFALDQALFDDAAAQLPDTYAAAGVVVHLSDGRAVYAQVSPTLLNRVMQVLAPEEFGELVDAIVSAVENPDDRTFCQRMRDSAAD